MEELVRIALKKCSCPKTVNINMFIITMIIYIFSNELI